ncbi:hypothetical protein KI387_017390 [Taxus chinensis]|uniref:Uncharacterized protein n=1 Tax=Taxus chinensis TaxID=29808 RepID=A0AA38GGN7_TAXCH|nr:hypothetical protein KI387_017390 [Taxus chinensis]
MLLRPPGLEIAARNCNPGLLWVSNSAIKCNRLGNSRFIKGRQFASLGNNWALTRKNRTRAFISHQGFLPFTEQSREIGSKYAVDQYSDDEYEPVETSNAKVSASVANIDEWKWKLSMLIRNNEEQEIVSKERKDRRDYEQIAAIATRMGLYSQQYTRVVVVSKVLLPNYRPDLDEKRPQREVVIPLGLQKRVESLLQQHLVAKHNNPDLSLDSGICGKRNNVGLISNEDGLLEQIERKMPRKTVLENILKRRSLDIRNKQRAWQETPEGQKMLEFRRSLPSYKEKDALLEAVARNQYQSVQGCSSRKPLRGMNWKFEEALTEHGFNKTWGIWRKIPNARGKAKKNEGTHPVRRQSRERPVVWVDCFAIKIVDEGQRGLCYCGRSRYIRKETRESYYE